MIQGIVERILLRYLAPYVDGISKDSLNVGIWSGNLTLENLSVKPNITELLNLPVSINSGRIGKIVISLPWKSLFTKNIKPATVDIYDLSLTLTQREMPEKSVDEFVESLRDGKLNRTLFREAALREMHEAKQATTLSNDSQGGESYVSSIVNRLVKMIQFSVNNVHIYFHDPVRQARAGLELEHFSVRSTDAHFKIASDEKELGSAPGLFKVLSLTGFGIYANVNPDYILKSKHNIVANRKLEDQNPSKNKILLDTSTPPLKHERTYILRPISTVVTFAHRPDDLSLEISIKVDPSIKGLAITRSQFAAAVHLQRDMAKRQQLELLAAKDCEYILVSGTSADICHELKRLYSLLLKHEIGIAPTTVSNIHETTQQGSSSPVGEAVNVVEIKKRIGDIQMCIATETSARCRFDAWLRLLLALKKRLRGSFLRETKRIGIRRVVAEGFPLINAIKKSKATVKDSNATPGAIALSTSLVEYVSSLTSTGTIANQTVAPAANSNTANSATAATGGGWLSWIRGTSTVPDATSNATPANSDNSTTTAEENIDDLDPDELLAELKSGSSSLENFVAPTECKFVFDLVAFPILFIDDRQTSSTNSNEGYGEAANALLAFLPTDLGMKLNVARVESWDGNMAYNVAFSAHIGNIWIGNKGKDVLSLQNSTGSKSTKNAIQVPTAGGLFGVSSPVASMIANRMTPTSPSPTSSRVSPTAPCGSFTVIHTNDSLGVKTSVCSFLLPLEVKISPSLVSDCLDALFVPNMLTVFESGSHQEELALVLEEQSKIQSSAKQFSMQRKRNQQLIESSIGGSTSRLIGADGGEGEVNEGIFSDVINATKNTFEYVKNNSNLVNNMTSGKDTNLINQQHTGSVPPPPPLEDEVTLEKKEKREVESQELFTVMHGIGPQIRLSIDITLSGPIISLIGKNDTEVVLNTGKLTIQTPSAQDQFINVRSFALGVNLQDISIECVAKSPATKQKKNKIVVLRPVPVDMQLGLQNFSDVHLALFLSEIFMDLQPSSARIIASVPAAFAAPIGEVVKKVRSEEKEINQKAEELQTLSSRRSLAHLQSSMKERYKKFTKVKDGSSNTSDSSADLIKKMINGENLSADEIWALFVETMLRDAISKFEQEMKKLGLGKIERSVLISSSEAFLNRNINNGSSNANTDSVNQGLISNSGNMTFSPNQNDSDDEFNSDDFDEADFLDAINSLQEARVSNESNNSVPVGKSGESFKTLPHSESDTFLDAIEGDIKSPSLQIKITKEHNNNSNNNKLNNKSLLEVSSRSSPSHRQSLGKDLSSEIKNLTTGRIEEEKKASEKGLNVKLALEISRFGGSIWNELLVNNTSNHDNVVKIDKLNTKTDVLFNRGDNLIHMELKKVVSEVLYANGSTSISMIISQAVVSHKRSVVFFETLGHSNVDFLQHLNAQDDNFNGEEKSEIDEEDEWNEFSDANSSVEETINYLKDEAAAATTTFNADNLQKKPSTKSIYGSSNQKNKNIHNLDKNNNNMLTFSDCDDIESFASVTDENEENFARSSSKNILKPASSSHLQSNHAHKNSNTGSRPSLNARASFFRRVSVVFDSLSVFDNENDNSVDNNQFSNYSHDKKSLILGIPNDLYINNKVDSLDSFLSPSTKRSNQKNASQDSNNNDQNHLVNVLCILPSSPLAPVDLRVSLGTSRLRWSPSYISTLISELDTFAKSTLKDINEAQMELSRVAESMDMATTASNAQGVINSSPLDKGSISKSLKMENIFESLPYDLNSTMLPPSAHPVPPPSSNVDDFLVPQMNRSAWSLLMSGFNSPFACVPLFESIAHPSSPPPTKKKDSANSIWKDPKNLSLNFKVISSSLLLELYLSEERHHFMRVCTAGLDVNGCLLNGGDSCVNIGVDSFVVELNGRTIISPPSITATTKSSQKDKENDGEIRDSALRQTKLLDLSIHSYASKNPANSRRAPWSMSIRGNIGQLVVLAHRKEIDVIISYLSGGMLSVALESSVEAVKQASMVSYILMGIQVATPVLVLPEDKCRVLRYFSRKGTKPMVPLAQHSSDLLLASARQGKKDRISNSNLTLQASLGNSVSFNDGGASDIATGGDLSKDALNSLLISPLSSEYYTSGMMDAHLASDLNLVHSRVDLEGLGSYLEIDLGSIFLRNSYLWPEEEIQSQGFYTKSEEDDDDCGPVSPGVFVLDLHFLDIKIRAFDAWRQCTTSILEPCDLLFTCICDPNEYGIDLRWNSLTLNLPAPAFTLIFDVLNENVLGAAYSQTPPTFENFKINREAAAAALAKNTTSSDSETHDIKYSGVAMKVRLGFIVESFSIFTSLDYQTSSIGLFMLKKCEMALNAKLMDSSLTYDFVLAGRESVLEDLRPKSVNAHRRMLHCFSSFDDGKNTTDFKTDIPTLQCVSKNSSEQSVSKDNFIMECFQLKKLLQVDCENTKKVFGGLPFYQTLQSNLLGLHSSNQLNDQSVGNDECNVDDFEGDEDDIELMKFYGIDKELPKKINSPPPANPEFSHSSSTIPVSSVNLAALRTFSSINHSTPAFKLAVRQSDSSTMRIIFDVDECILNVLLQFTMDLSQWIMDGWFRSTWNRTPRPNYGPLVAAYEDRLRAEDRLKKDAVDSADADKDAPSASQMSLKWNVRQGSFRTYVDPSNPFSNYVECRAAFGIALSIESTMIVVTELDFSKVVLSRVDRFRRSIVPYSLPTNKNNSKNSERIPLKSFAADNELGASSSQTSITSVIEEKPPVILTDHLRLIGSGAFRYSTSDGAPAVTDMMFVLPELSICLSSRDVSILSAAASNVFADGPTSCAPVYQPSYSKILEVPLLQLYGMNRRGRIRVALRNLIKQQVKHAKLKLSKQQGNSSEKINKNIFIQAAKTHLTINRPLFSVEYTFSTLSRLLSNSVNNKNDASDKLDDEDSLVGIDLTLPVCVLAGDSLESIFEALEVSKIPLTKFAVPYSLRGLLPPYSAVGTRAVVGSKLQSLPQPEKMMDDFEYIQCDPSVIVLSVSNTMALINENIDQKVESGAKSSVFIGNEEKDATTRAAENDLVEDFSMPTPHMAISMTVQGVKLTFMDDSKIRTVIPVMNAEMSIENLCVQYSGVGGGRVKYMVHDFAMKANYLNTMAGVWEPVIEHCLISLDYVTHSPIVYKTLLIGIMEKYKRDVEKELNRAMKTNDLITASACRSKLVTFPRDLLPSSVALALTSPITILINITPQLVGMLTWFLPHVSAALGVAATSYDNSEAVHEMDLSYIANNEGFASSGLGNRNSLARIGNGVVSDLLGEARKSFNVFDFIESSLQDPEVSLGNILLPRSLLKSKKDLQPLYSNGILLNNSSLLTANSADALVGNRAKASSSFVSNSCSSPININNADNENIGFNDNNSSIVAPSSSIIQADLSNVMKSDLKNKGFFLYPFAASAFSNFSLNATNPFARSSGLEGVGDIYSLSSSLLNFNPLHHSIINNPNSNQSGNIDFVSHSTETKLRSILNRLYSEEAPACGYLCLNLTSSSMLFFSPTFATNSSLSNIIPGTPAEIPTSPDHLQKQQHAQSTLPSETQYRRFQIAPPNMSGFSLDSLVGSLSSGAFLSNSRDSISSFTSNQNSSATSNNASIAATDKTSNNQANSLSVFSERVGEDQTAYLGVLPLIPAGLIKSLVNAFPSVPTRRIVAALFDSKDVNFAAEMMSVNALHANVASALERSLPPPASVRIPIGKDTSTFVGLPSPESTWSGDSLRPPIDQSTQKLLTQNGVISRTFSSQPSQRIVLISTPITVHNHSNIPLECVFLDTADSVCPLPIAFPFHRVASMAQLNGEGSNETSRLKQLIASSNSASLNPSIGSSRNFETSVCGTPSLQRFPSHLAHFESKYAALKYCTDKVKSYCAQNPSFNDDLIYGQLGDKTNTSLILPMNHVCAVPESSLHSMTKALLSFRPVVFNQGREYTPKIHQFLNPAEGWCDIIDTHSMASIASPVNDIKIMRVSVRPSFLVDDRDLGSIPAVYFHVVVIQSQLPLPAEAVKTEVHIFPPITLVNASPCALNFKIDFSRAPLKDNRLIFENIRQFAELQENRRKQEAARQAQSIPGLVDIDKNNNDGESSNDISRSPSTNLGNSIDSLDLSQNNNNTNSNVTKRSRFRLRRALPAMPSLTHNSDMVDPCKGSIELRVDTRTSLSIHTLPICDAQMKVARADCENPSWSTNSISNILYQCSLVANFVRRSIKLTPISAAGDDTKMIKESSRRGGDTEEAYVTTLSIPHETDAACSLEVSRGPLATSTPCRYLSALQVSLIVSAPRILIDRTGIDITPLLRSEDAGSGSDEMLKASRVLQKSRMYLLSPPDDLSKIGLCAVMKVANNNTNNNSSTAIATTMSSSPTSFYKIGKVDNVDVPLVGGFSEAFLNMPDGSIEALTLQCDEIDTECTCGATSRLVSVLPQVLVSNRFAKWSLQVRQHNVDHALVTIIPPLQSARVKWSTLDAPLEISVRPDVRFASDQFAFDWSSPICPREEMAGAKPLALVSLAQVQLQEKFGDIGVYGMAHQNELASIFTKDPNIQQQIRSVSMEHVVCDVAVVSQRGLRSVTISPAGLDLDKSVHDYETYLVLKSNSESAKNVAERTALQKRLQLTRPSLASAPRGIILINRSRTAKLLVAKTLHSADDRRMAIANGLLNGNELKELTFFARSSECRFLSWPETYRLTTRKLNIHFWVNKDTLAPEVPITLYIQTLNFQPSTNRISGLINVETGESYPTLLISTERKGDLFIVQLIDETGPAADLIEHTAAALTVSNTSTHNLSLGEDLSLNKTVTKATENSSDVFRFSSLYQRFSASRLLSCLSAFGIRFNDRAPVLQQQQQLSSTDSNASITKNKANLSYPAVFLQFQITPERFNQISTSISIQVQLNSLGLSLISHKQQQEVIYMEMRQFSLSFVQSGDDQVVDFCIGDLQVDCQVISNTQAALDALVNSSVNAPVSSISDNPTTSISPSEESLHMILFAPISSSSSGTFLAIHVERNFSTAADLVLSNVTIHVDSLEVAVNDTSFYSIQALLDEMGEAMATATAISDLSSDNKRTVFGQQGLNEGVIRLEDVSVWAFQPMNLFTTWKTPPLPMVILLGNLLVSKLQFQVWCNLSLIRLHYLPSFVKTILKVISLSGDLTLSGAPLRFEELQLRSIRASLTSALTLLVDKYRQHFVKNVMPLLTHSSLVNVPVIPLKFAAKSVEGALGFTSSGLNTVGNFVAHCSFDSEYINKRQHDAKHKPSSFVDGLNNASRNIGEAFIGLASIVRVPKQGAERNGAAGFFTGLGKGLVGSFVKPIDKIGQAMGNIASGVQAELRGASQGQLKFRTTRQRLPRALWGAMARVRPYSSTDAKIFLSLGVSSARNQQNIIGRSGEFNSSTIMEIDDIVIVDNGSTSCLALVLGPLGVMLIEIYKDIATATQRAQSLSNRNNSAPNNVSMYRMIWRLSYNSIDRVIASTHGVLIKSKSRSVEDAKIPISVSNSVGMIEDSDSKLSGVKLLRGGNATAIAEVVKIIWRAQHNSRQQLSFQTGE